MKVLIVAEEHDKHVLALIKTLEETNTVEHSANLKEVNSRTLDQLEEIDIIYVEETFVENIQEVVSDISSLGGTAVILSEFIYDYNRADIDIVYFGYNKEAGLTNLGGHLTDVDLDYDKYYVTAPTLLSIENNEIKTSTEVKDLIREYIITETDPKYGLDKYVKQSTWNFLSYPKEEEQVYLITTQLPKHIIEMIQEGSK